MRHVQHDCRAEIAIMAERGDVDFFPTDADYFNPFLATRVATVWFRRELRHAEGDIDLAIRAYHRGHDNALDERGDAYLARVLWRRAHGTFATAGAHRRGRI